MSNLGGVASVLDYCQFYDLVATHYLIIIFKSMNIIWYILCSCKLFFESGDGELSL